MHRHILFIIALMVLTQGGCITLRPSASIISSTRKYARPPKISTEQREKLVSLARQALGKARIAEKPHMRADCSGTIRALFAQAKIPLGGIIKNPNDNDVKTIYRYVQKYGQILKSDPQAGDLVFFHNTYNLSRSGLMNDALTHVGLIEKIDQETIYFVHHLGRLIIRSRMSLAHPRLARDPKTKQRINHILRRAYGREKSYTAGELFAGFGRL
jgi:hypothetical protein